MKKITGLVGMATLALMLSACSGDDDNTQKNSGSIDDGEQTNENGSIDHRVTENGKKEGSKDESGEDGIDVGFSLEGGSIEEAANVPTEQKEAIVEAFNRYIDTLNAGDVDAYLETLSEDGYNVDEERAATEELLATHVLTRTPEDITIVKYSDTEAQVFTSMETAIKDKESEEQDVNVGRQVTVMANEDGNWRVKSVHYIGDQEPKE
ncbi:nuclear transport factor 2 family protein [Sporosarcina sp. D27]|uniref:YybH family protein n=1 Tax=Sporosarcina sp. D27 TaxID=1382305 RepID=UPI000470DA83|nr:nuclear transport factor 2 family protein [Sporosarcina sp. D27]